MSLAFHLWDSGHRAFVLRLSRPVLPKAVPWSFSKMTVLLSSCLFHQCLLEEVAYEVSDQLQAGMLTPLPAAQRSHSITLHHVLRVPGLLTCTRSPVGSHVIIFLRLLPHFGRVYPLVTFWERVHGKQLHFKLDKSLKCVYSAFTPIWYFE